MKKKILIIGATGMLGHQVTNVLASEKNFKIFATYKSKKNLVFLKKFKKKVTFLKFDIIRNKNFNLIKKYNFNYIINCAGIIKPYIFENNSHSVINALKINSQFPHELSKNFKRVKIFQIATDCVYSGKRGNYLENDFHDPLDVYGKSKSLGEVKSDHFFNLRCSIIGREQKGKLSLVEWFLNLKENSIVNGFINHNWNGITTQAYAHYLLAIIKYNIKIPNNIHIIPKNKVTKFKMLNIFKKYFARNDLKIKKINAENSINRTLDTLYSSLNLFIWKKTKYKSIPDLSLLIKELSVQ